MTPRDKEELARAKEVCGPPQATPSCHIRLPAVVCRMPPAAPVIAPAPAPVPALALIPTPTLPPPPPPTPPLPLHVASAPAPAPTPAPARRPVQVDHSSFAEDDGAERQRSTAWEVLWVGMG